MNALQAFDRDYAREGCRVIGLDEAGRGALAGPVMAGACVLHGDFFGSAEVLRRSAGVHDSKQLTPAARKEQLAVIDALRAEGVLDYAVGAGSVASIERWNILGATRRAMAEALERLAERASAGDGGWALPGWEQAEPLFAARSRVRILVDGRPLRPFAYAHEGVIGGDGRSLAIAVASIAAKVTRDREMERLAETYPDYGFERHKGYGTADHRERIRKYGPGPVHRPLFVRKVLAG